MSVIRCSIKECEYRTPDVDSVVAEALLTTHATVHASSHSVMPTAKAQKVKCPCIWSAGTTKDWQYFRSRWSDYVKATKLLGTDKIIQLLECCDDQLRKDLTRNAGGTLTGKTEDEVLAAIKTLAVREENVMVARVMLHNMKQDRGEPIRAYGATLWGQASTHCYYVVQMQICYHYFLLLRRVYLTIDISFHPNSETITHSENIYIVLMVLSCTRIELLSCHPFNTIVFWLFMQHINVFLL